MKKPSICAVIPAAGRGSRLGIEGPKILAPISASRTVWTILRDKLLRHVDRVHVIIAPAYRVVFEDAIAGDAARDRISVGVQPEPRGMGDALMSNYESWRSFDSLLVIWGDQVHVSDDTLRRSLDLHRSHAGPRCTLPLVEVPNPYVQYVFGGALELTAIRETREGDRTDPVGLADSGVFILQVEGLQPAWSDYLACARPGSATGELNFLPFLVYLARRRGWPFHSLRIDDPDEARGINTPADLEFFREHYRRMDDA